MEVTEVVLLLVGLEVALWKVAMEVPQVLAAEEVLLSVVVVLLDAGLLRLLLRCRCAA